ncbi:hypothetical protein Plec18170_006029 [Paecilomyces lecythidis]
MQKQEVNGARAARSGALESSSKPEGQLKRGEDGSTGDDEEIEDMKSRIEFKFAFRSCVSLYLGPVGRQRLTQRMLANHRFANCKRRGQTAEPRCLRRELVPLAQ